ncbi:MAG: ParA family protein [Actinobacteria bacterium]|nr:ParA family protein [Actinomycetota bacterium]
MHVLSLSALKGGVGKTTMTLGLASAAMAKGLRTLVVDLDPQCNTSTGLGAAGDLEYSVAEVLKKPRHNTVLKAIVAASWAKGQTGKLDVLVAQPHLTNLNIAKPSFKQLWHLEEALAKVENDYDLVLIDTPPSINALTRMAWVASDRVLLVTEPTFNSVLGVEQGVKALEEIRKQVNRQVSLAGVVVNRLRRSLAEHQFRMNELSDIYGDLLIDVAFEEKAAVSQSQGAGRAIHSWPGQSAAKIANQFDQLLAKLEESFLTEDPKRARERRSGKTRNRYAHRSQASVKDEKAHGRRAAAKIDAKAERIELHEQKVISPEYEEKFNEVLKQTLTEKQIKSLKNQSNDED